MKTPKKESTHSYDTLEFSKSPTVAEIRHFWPKKLTFMVEKSP
jgi:hypothetical protein